MACREGAAAPPSGNSEGSPRVRQSRGSIARPEHWLSTLRGGDYSPPRKTRFRLSARLYRVGLATHRAATKGFRDARLHRFPLSRASLVAMPACQPNGGGWQTVFQGASPLPPVCCCAQTCPVCQPAKVSRAPQKGAIGSQAPCPGSHHPPCPTPALSRQGGGEQRNGSPQPGTTCHLCPCTLQ